MFVDCQGGRVWVGVDNQCGGRTQVQWQLQCASEWQKDLLGDLARAAGVSERWGWVLQLVG